MCVSYLSSTPFSMRFNTFAKNGILRCCKLWKYWKQKNGGVSFFCLTKDDKLKKKCLINVRRENLPKDVRICHLHFQEFCFKRDLEVIHYSVYIFIHYPLNRIFNQKFIIPHNGDISLIFSAQTF